MHKCPEGSDETSGTRGDAILIKAGIKKSN